MISNIGNFLLLGGMVLPVIAIINKKPRFAKKLFYLSSFAIISSFIMLVIGFITSDFSIQNVFLNSSTIKPLIYKISGTWASHEGSMLFWLSLFCLISMIYIYSTCQDSINRIQIVILSSIIILFATFIYLTSNPFIALSFTPPEGLGLNPALQDIALAIHPPILYLGYVSYVVLFTNAIVVLLKNENDALRIELFKLSKMFSNFGLLTLTLGVGLGAWWAYRELGWGGYWFFDPVENISLLPWLSAIGLHHSLLISIKHKRFIIWTLRLSILTFLLIIFGIFLVRSGLLTSVHSFASSPERAIYLFVIFLILALPSTALLMICGKKFREDNTSTFKETGFKIANILWTLSIVILLCTILYPIIYSYFYNDSISLNLEFFTYNFLPIIILILGVTGIFSTKGKNNSSQIITVISLIITIASAYLIKYNFISSTAVLCSTYLILQTLYILISRSNFFQVKISPTAAALIAGHLGCGLLALSITFNTLLQNEIEFVGSIGESREVNQFNVTLKNISLAEGKNYYRQIAEFWITNLNNHSITILKPENRYYKIEKVLSQESDIYSYLTHDIYAVLNKIDGGTIHAIIYYRPLISFIWLSILMICTGFLISLLNHHNKYKTTSRLPKF